MTTFMILQTVDCDLKFYKLDGNYAHLDEFYMGGTLDPKKEQELIDLIIDPDTYNYRPSLELEEWTKELRDHIGKPFKIISCGEL